jgi:uracil-DNA glycosylase
MFNWYKSSNEAFKEVIRELKPKLVIFWGHRLWDYFPKDGYLKTTDNNEKTIHYLDSEIKTPILIVPHPSSSKFNFT